MRQKHEATDDDDYDANYDDDDDDYDANYDDGRWWLCGGLS